MFQEAWEDDPFSGADYMSQWERYGNGEYSDEEDEDAYARRIRRAPTTDDIIRSLALSLLTWRCACAVRFSVERSLRRPAVRRVFRRGGAREEKAGR